MAIIDNLESYWSMEGASGAGETDVHGSNNLAHGTNGANIGSTTGKVGNCRDFESSLTQSLSINDNASLSLGDIDVTFTAWVKIESVGQNMVIVGKWASTGSNREYMLRYSNAAGRFQFSVSPDGTSGAAATAQADVLGAPSLATWYFIVAWHDATNNELGIQINDGTPNTTAHSGGIANLTNIFKIGASNDSPSTFDGLIDEVGFWKNRVLSSTEKTWLCNSGNGRSYADIVAGMSSGPSVAAESSGSVAATTTPTYTLPSGVVNESLLIAIIGIDDAADIDWSGTGFTEMFQKHDGANASSLSVAYRHCDGTEGADITPTLASSVLSRYRILRISGHYVGFTPAWGPGDSASSAAELAPPSLSPSWGSAETLWIACCAYDDDAGTVSMSAFPTDYGDTQDLGTNTMALATCWRSNETGQETAGTFTLDGAESLVVNLIAVRPAGQGFDFFSVSQWQPERPQWIPEPY